jgi:hypothetical protein
MITTGRNLTRQIWITVSLPDTNHPTSTSTIKTQPQPHFTTPSLNARTLREEKIRALNLVTAYFYAVKHHLRREPGLHHSDMVGLLPSGFQRFERETLTTHDAFTTSTNGTYTETATPGDSRIKGVGTSTIYPDQRTPLLNQQDHIIHFHSLPSAESQCLPLM